MNELSRPRVIAVEEHFVTEGYRKSLRTEALFADELVERQFWGGVVGDGLIARRLIDLDSRREEMDRLGIDIELLSLNPPGVQVFSDAAHASAIAREANDELAAIVEQSAGRFRGLGTVAPQDPTEAAREVARIMGPLHLSGVLISSHTHGHYLDEPAFEPLLSALEEHDATLYLHPRTPSRAMVQPLSDYAMGGSLWGFGIEASTHVVRLILSGTLDRHPNLRIVLGHLGEGLPFWLWRLDNAYNLVYGWAGPSLGMVDLELTPTEYFIRNFCITTSGMYDPATFTFCLNKLGHDRILFAIDTPYEHADTAMRFLQTLPMSAEQLRQVSSANAERLFRM